MKDYLQETAERFGYPLTLEQCDKFMEFARLLLSWNERMNLTAITDEKEIVLKHFLDSLSVFKALPKNKCTLIDIGTGAGFPGIPLKIYSRDINLTLLDALQKRIIFLQTVTDELGLDNVSCLHGRAEELGRIQREQYDYATARAVAHLSVLSELALPLVKVGGFFIALKGPEAHDEIREALPAVDALGACVEDLIAYDLDGNGRRLVVLRKVRECPPEYPRRFKKISTSPIGGK